MHRSRKVQEAEVAGFIARPLNKRPIPAEQILTGILNSTSITSGLLHLNFYNNRLIYFNSTSTTTGLLSSVSVAATSFIFGELLFSAASIKVAASIY